MPEINKEINAVEDDLDHDLTEYKEVHEKLETVQKESREAELQVNALRRRLALAEEEKTRCEEKTWEAQDKYVSLLISISRPVFKIDNPYLANALIETSP